jgi:hypothetical protein
MQGFDFRQRTWTRDFSVLNKVQPDSYKMGTGDCFFGDRTPGADVKNGGALPPISHTCSSRGA